MRIVFVRHGEKQPLAGRRDHDWPLSPAAQETTKQLEGNPGVRFGFLVYSSAPQRQLATIDQENTPPKSDRKHRDKPAWSCE
jgi:broad specificity phosphatase PhoE